MKKVRTQTKRALSVLLAVVMIALTVPMAFADAYLYKTIYYDFNEKTGTLRFQKSGGTAYECVDGNIDLGFFYYTSDHQPISSYQEAVQLCADFYGKVKTLRFDASLDSVQVQNHGYSDENFEANKQNFSIKMVPVIGVGTPFVTDVIYPKVVINQSMSAYVDNTTFFAKTSDGKRVTNFIDTEGLLHHYSFDPPPFDSEDLAQFNYLFGTNFKTFEECEAYLPTMELMVAPMIIYCKKGSNQQKFIDSLNLMLSHKEEYWDIDVKIECKKTPSYILIDDSTAKKDKATNVGVTYNNTAFSTPVTMNVNTVNTGKANTVAYDITPKDAAGNKVQPDENVLISLPIPSGWNEADLRVVHTKDDGTTETPDFAVVDGNAEFFTDSFSTFALVNSASDSTTQPDGTQGEETSTTQQNPENNSGKKLNFFQRLLQFFRNLFDQIFRRK